MSLQEQLDTFAAQARATLPSGWQAVLDRATENACGAGLVAASLKVGDRVPEFALPNARGQIVRSEDLLSKGHLVVSFYRGGW